MAEWIAPERLYLDAEGNVVKADNPKRARLLVAAGLSLPMTEALRLGLVNPDPPAVEPTAANTRAVTDEATGEVVASITEDAPEPETKAVTAPPANKAQRGPAATK